MMKILLVVPVLATAMIVIEAKGKGKDKGKVNAPQSDNRVTGNRVDWPDMSQKLLDKY